MNAKRPEVSALAIRGNTIVAVGDADWADELRYLQNAAGAVPAPFGFGLWTAHFTPNLLGATTVVTERFDPDRALELIEREKVTNFSGVPTMSREMLMHPDWATRDTSSLQGMGGGGAALQPDLVQKIAGKPAFALKLTKEAINKTLDLQGQANAIDAAGGSECAHVDVMAAVEPAGHGRRFLAVLVLVEADRGRSALS